MSGSDDKLFAIAEGQLGYFTAGQAVACGYPTSNHVYHLKTGRWIREWRGIYRVARFPAMEGSQYALWSLWSRNRAGEPQGVYSHETALSLFELSDVMPGRFHMTVPPGFRRNSAIPQILELHRGMVSSKDIEIRQGYSVTLPLRTVVDLLNTASVSKDHLKAALEQALSRGLIPRKQMQQHPKHDALESLLKGK